MEVPIKKRRRPYRFKVSLYVCPVCNRVWQPLRSYPHLFVWEYLDDFPRLGADKKLCPNHNENQTKPHLCHNQQEKEEELWWLD